MWFANLLLVVATLAISIFASPLSLRDYDVTLNDGVVEDNGLPAGYTWGVLHYNITLNGTEHHFEGYSQEHIFELVVAELPDFEIPYEDEAVVAKGYADFAAARGTSRDLDIPVSHTSEQGMSGAQVKTRDFIQGPGYHLYTLPIPGQNWGAAPLQDAWNGVNRYVRDGGYYWVNPMQCSLWTCSGNAGWTICNDRRDPVWWYQNSWYSLLGRLLLNQRSACFTDSNGQQRCGGQIFLEGSGMNMIIRSGWGC